MFTTLKNACKIAPLRKKILYTLLMIVVFRLGANIPVPGVNRAALIAQMSGGQDTLIGIFNLISGNAFKQYSIFALGISPYITSSIIMNLLTIAIPSLERLSKQGVEGRKKIAQFTRYGTVAIALLQGYGFSYGYFRRVFFDPSFKSISLAVLILTAGTAFLMYLGEHITEKGIGNGISLFIFSGIIAGLPDGVINMYVGVVNNQVNIISVVVFLVVALFMIAGIIMVNEGSRKVPVQYAKRVVGRKMYGGQSTHIPLKVNQAGVIPVIFAVSVLAVPSTIAAFMPNSGFYTWVQNYLTNKSVLFIVLEFLMIIFFAYFYTSISFNPFEIAENLKKNGGFIPGIRPGKPTVEYLKRSVSRLILLGALFLGVVAIFPNLVAMFGGINVGFGGTSIIIVVGVALETTKQIEAQMLMRNYKGFL